MKLQTMKCPDCGGQLYFEEDQDVCFCSHCGAQVTKNSHQTITYRAIDEARIRETDNKRDIAIRQMEFQERREKRLRKTNLYWTLGISFGAPLLIFIVFQLIFNSESSKEYEAKKQEQIANGWISAGYYEDYRSKNYQSVIAMLESAGFTNIETIELNDYEALDGMLDTLVIGGETKFYPGDYFSPDVKIVVTYH